MDTPQNLPQEKPSNYDDGIWSEKQTNNKENFSSFFFFSFILDPESFKSLVTPSNAAISFVGRGKEGSEVS